VILEVSELGVSGIGMGRRTSQSNTMYSTAFQVIVYTQISQKKNLPRDFFKLFVGNWSVDSPERERQRMEKISIIPPKESPFAASLLLSYFDSPFMSYAITHLFLFLLPPFALSSLISGTTAASSCFGSISFGSGSWSSVAGSFDSE